MCALIDLSVAFNYTCSFHEFFLMISYIYSTFPIYHVSNDYDYVII